MEKENNPVMADLEDDIPSSSNPNKNIFADISMAIETILSEEHIDQKTNISYENEEGLICIDVLQAHMLRSFNYQFPSLQALKMSKQEHVLSVNGYRSNQIAEIFKSLQPNIISGDVPLSSRLLGKR